MDQEEGQKKFRHEPDDVVRAWPVRLGERQQPIWQEESEIFPKLNTSTYWNFWDLLSWPLCCWDRTEHEDTLWIEGSYKGCALYAHVDIVDTIPRRHLDWALYGRHMHAQRNIYGRHQLCHACLSGVSLSVFFSWFVWPYIVEDCVASSCAVWLVGPMYAVWSRWDYVCEFGTHAFWVVSSPYTNDCCDSVLLKHQARPCTLKVHQYTTIGT